MYKQIDGNKNRTVLLMGIFLVFVIGLGWLFSYLYNNQIILVVAVLIAFIQALVSYYYSDQISLAVSGAKEVKRKDELTLFRVVENLSITAGIPVPKIYIIEDIAPNAFATGRDPRHASIAVTRGLLEKLNKNELEGVIAHELSHDKNYDIRLMSVVVVLVGVVALLSNWFLRWNFWFGGRRDDRGNGQFGVVMLIIGIILSILAPIAATLIQLAISRKREFLADADGALLTRYPQGLASALEKIAKDQNQLHSANAATAHLFIASPLKAKKNQISWFTKLFMTHPPVEERIKALKEMIE